MAYVWLPAIFIALEKMLKSASACALVAVAYTGLILSHLPSALLAAPFMTIYVISRAGILGLPQSVVRLVFGAMLGVALSAVYLLPTISMRDLVSPAGWLADMGEGSLPDSWLFFGTGGVSAFGVTVYRSLAAVSVLALVVWCLSIVMRHRPFDETPAAAAAQGRMIVTAFASIGICWLLMGVPPAWLWSKADFLRTLQFPLWPGQLVDFFSATVIVLSGAKIVGWMRYRLARRWRPESWSLLAYVGILLVPCLVSTINLIEYRSIFAARTWIDPSPKDLRAATPYQPRKAADSTVFRQGMSEVRASSIRRRHERGFERLRRRLANRPDITLSRKADTGEAVTIERVGATDFEIDAVLVQPATVVLGRFYFPTWRLIDVKSGRKIAIRATKDTGLIAFDLPAGTNWLHLDIVRTELHEYGVMLSTGAALVVALILFGRFRRKPPPVGYKASRSGSVRRP